MRVAATCFKLPQFDKDMKHLNRHHRSVERDVVHIERLLVAGIELPQTYSYPGFQGHRVFKVRVVNTGEKQGKSNAYRLVYEEIEAEPYKLLFFIMLYTHATHSNESEIRNELRVRLNSSEYKALCSECLL